MVLLIISVGIAIFSILSFILFMTAPIAGRGDYGSLRTLLEWYNCCTESRSFIGAHILVGFAFLFGIIFISWISFKFLKNKNIRFTTSFGSLLFTNLMGILLFITSIVLMSAPSIADKVYNSSQMKMGGASIAILVFGICSLLGAISYDVIRFRSPIYSVIPLFDSSSTQKVVSSSSITKPANPTMYDASTIQMSLDTTKKIVQSYVVTASSNTGRGLWTSICCMFCGIFGTSSRNYEKKLKKIKNMVLSELKIQCKKVQADALTNVVFAISDLHIVASATAVVYEK